jgi:hypothetical protein
LAKLNLSSSLAPEVPASVAAKGTGVTAGAINVAALTSRKKSREACNIRQKIKTAKMQQESMAMDLCFIESQRGMKAGGKYKLKFSMPASAGLNLQDIPGGDIPSGDIPSGDIPSGDIPSGDMPSGDMPSGDMPSGESPSGTGQEMTFSVFLDNSDKNNFKVFMCDNDKLTQKIVLSGASDKGSRGSYKTKFEEDGFSVSLSGQFDNGVAKAGRQTSAAQMAFAMKMGNDTSHMRSSMVLDIVADGISTVKVANESSMTASDFSAADKEIGVALIGPTIGSALFQRTYTGSGSFFPDGGDQSVPPMTLALNAEQQVETSRTYFDNAGQTLAKADSASFNNDGPLHVKEAMFPKLLPNDFAVTFDATDWDCSGAVDFTVNMDSPEFKACETKFQPDFSDEQCDGDTYIVGFEEEIPAFVNERGDLDGELPPFDPNAEPVPAP